jgi:uncharacterized protein (TIGR02246 family)
MVLATGCTLDSSVPRTEAELAAEVQAIEALDEALTQAAQAGDAALFASFFAEDAIQMPPNAPQLEGRVAIQESAAGFLGSGVSLRFETSDVHVARLGDLATSRGKYYLVIDTPDGPVRDEGSYIEVWKRIDGEWKIVADIYNSDVPAG